MTTHTYAGHTLAEIKEAADAAWLGPWKVVLDEHQHYCGGTHKERRIFTAWDHPQLGCPAPIVNGSVGIPAEKDGPAIHMVSIDQVNADHIATANPATVLDMAARIEELERDRHAARLEGFRLAREMAAKACDFMQYFRLEGFAKREATNKDCAAVIRNLLPPGEWFDIGNTISPTVAEWPHPDGFAGGLTEQQK